MIAIFDIEKDALKLSGEIHEFLSKNRKGYNATSWGLRQYDNGYFHVKVPDDFKGEIPKVPLMDDKKVRVMIERKYFDIEEKEITYISKIDIAASVKTILNVRK